MTSIIDISPLISEDFAVFPGDTRFKRHLTQSMNDGDNFELSYVQSTLHVGAHADASSHYHPDGVSIEAAPLTPYIGKAQVIEVAKLPDPYRILPEHIAEIEITAPRVLFKTSSQPNPETWCDDFTALSPELIAQLASQGVILIGIDTPSVDPASSKALPSHAALFEHNVANLENLWLADVAPGEYSLIALPLRIRGGDASPVRAILMPIAEVPTLLS